MQKLQNDDKSKQKTKNMVGKANTEPYLNFNFNNY